MWQPSAASSSASSLSVSPASRRERPSQATASRRPERQPERGARVAALGDVGVELRLAGGEALGVERALEARRAFADEQRTGLEQVAARLRGQLVALADRHAAAVDADARAHVAPRAGERHVPAGDPVRAQLTQRHAARADEESAHQRVLDPTRRAPWLEPLRLAQDRHAQLGGALGIRDHVDGGREPAGERDACACEAPGAGCLAGERDGHGRRLPEGADVHVNIV